nr:PREDICTED: methyltransferase-like protein 16 homolog [Bemisia tabaci]
MHPRNIYRTPPNFKELALQFPELRPYAKPDLNGKVQIDFKNQDALRVLLKVLLIKDFQLNIELPPEKLVPTLPLRLNYILWIEDLLEHAGLSNPVGIDIGVGASCIYSLLAAKKNNWRMLGTETDQASYQAALKNVEINSLQSLVKVVLVNEETILDGAIDEAEDYTFCMCNPPFFGSMKEVSGKSRSPNSRAPPRNAHTGIENELVTEGGEVAFVGRIIHDSKKLQNKVKIYTSMVGIKSNLKKLVSLLKSTSVESVTQTTFSQGRTMRWGVAWTYDKSVRLLPAPVSKKSKDKPLQQEFHPPHTPESVEKDVLALLDKLEIKHTEVKKKNSLKVFELTAYKNTWSHQRKLRRMAKRKQLVEENSTSMDIDESNDPAVNSESSSPIMVDAESLSPESGTERKPTDKLADNYLKNSEQDYSSSLCSSPNKRKMSPALLEEQDSGLDLDHENLKKLRLDDGKSWFDYAGNDPLLSCTLGIRDLKTKVLVDMLFSDGTGGKEAMNQVLLYIRNNMKQNTI